MRRLVEFSTSRKSAVSDAAEDDDARSDISKEDADVNANTALLSSGLRPPLGQPDVRRRLSWFSGARGKHVDDSHAIATQPSVFDDPVLADQYRPQPDW